MERFQELEEQEKCTKGLEELIYQERLNELNKDGSAKQFLKGRYDNHLQVFE